ncbi:MAG TPA: hypothetical protein VGM05_31030 [Planctomycetaceae bacterium]
MDDEAEIRGRGRIAVTATIGLSLVVLYALSIGPVFGLCYSKHSSFLFKDVGCRDSVLRRLYSPLIRSSETVGAERALWPYAGVFGADGRSSYIWFRAVELLMAAQDALAVGDIEKARSMTLRAEKFDVAYDVLGYTPEYVFAVIDRAERHRTLCGSSFECP